MKRNDPEEPQWVKDFFHGLIGKTDKKIAKRLRSRSGEMKAVYYEIEDQLSNSDKFPRPCGFSVLWAIIDSAALYDPSLLFGQRDIRKNLIETEKNISKTIKKLITLLDMRTEWEIKGIVISGADLHLASLIERALSNKHCLETDKFTILASMIKRDFPDLQEVLENVITEIKLNDPETLFFGDEDVLLSSQKKSYHDVHRRLEASLMEMMRINELPKNFKFSRASYATIVKCALDLQGVEIDETSISHARRKK